MNRRCSCAGIQLIFDHVGWCRQCRIDRLFQMMFKVLMLSEVQCVKNDVNGVTTDDVCCPSVICFVFFFFFFLNGWLVDWLNFILKLKCRHGGNLVTWPILSMDNESSKIHIIFSYYFLNRSIGIVKSKRSLTKAIYRKNHENRWTSPLIGQSYKYQFSCLIFANILLLPIFYCFPVK